MNDAETAFAAGAVQGVSQLALRTWEKTGRSVTARTRERIVFKLAID